MHRVEGARHATYPPRRGTGLEPRIAFLVNGAIVALTAAVIIYLGRRQGFLWARGHAPSREQQRREIIAGVVLILMIVVLAVVRRTTGWGDGGWPAVVGRALAVGLTAAVLQRWVRRAR